MYWAKISMSGFVYFCSFDEKKTAAFVRRHETLMKKDKRSYPAAKQVRYQFYKRMARKVKKVFASNLSLMLIAKCMLCRRS